MNPNNGSQSGGAPSPSSPQDHQSAAANVLRSQIDALYGDRPVAVPTREAQESPPRTEPNPYQRTHDPHPQPQAEQWKQYHSAWQNYYQQYYAAYYAYQQAVQGKTEKTEDKPAAEPQGYFSPHTEPEETAEDFSKDQALYELRQKLLGKVRHQAKKIRGSKHFMPIAASLAVVLVFLFLQYNRVLFAAVNAYVSPGSIDPQNIVIDPSGGTAVSEDPRLVIPKINVDVPVLYDVGADYDSQMSAMAKGVAHFSIPGANSHPGEIGNTVISGHSSNDLFDGGEYKFIFAQLDKLNTGDTIYANYKGTRYTYVVTKKEVVMPTEVSKLVYTTNKPVMTLITCTPLGTSQKRLLVTAEQISPDPAAAAAAPSGNEQTGGEAASIPGQSSPTLIERLFGAR
jgi:sortase A